MIHLQKLCPIQESEFRDFTLKEKNYSAVFLQRQKRIVNYYAKKVRQRISVIPENWHFNSRFVLKTTKTPVFVFITEIL